MHSLILCRERLNRIAALLARHPQGLSVREFARTFSVWRWEVEQAAELGFVEIETRKPETGRPSYVVHEASKPRAAKLPPFRHEIEKEISTRHWLFAMRSRLQAVRRGPSKAMHAFGVASGLGNFTSAYRATFPEAKSQAGARASASRLLRHPDVRAVRAWFGAIIRQEVLQSAEMPNTAKGIWLGLHHHKKQRELSPTTSIVP